ncbi:MAG TPA: hypothetical protein VNC78_10790, partial [Actinomycetota bacterium]|nr:hypothetical protein [Actinomycetota bacterium]
ATCGLPTPRPGVDGDAFPAPFLLEGEAEVVRVQKRNGGIVAAINIPYSVAEGFALYKEASEEAGFTIAGEDNEGFEAELYLRSKDELASVQVRRSICETASIVFLNIVSKEALGAPSPVPVPTKTKKGRSRR